MTYYTSTSWWDVDYKIRRQLTFEPFELTPGDESRLAVKLNNRDFASKVKSDYSDVVVLEGTTPVPFYVISDSSYSTVVINPSSSISETNSNYWLYYLNEGATRASSDLLNLDSTTLDLTSIPSEDNTRWLLTNPTIDWVENKSVKKDARAAFNFNGHVCDVRFKVGPDKGKVSYSLNGGEETIVDTYAQTVGEANLIQINESEVSSNFIRIKALGTKTTYSSSTQVEIVNAKYNQILLGVASSEEFYSEVGFSIISGNN